MKTVQQEVELILEIAKSNHIKEVNLKRMEKTIKSENLLK